MLIRKIAQNSKTNEKESSGKNTEQINTSKSTCETKENNELEANTQLGFNTRPESSDDCIVIADDVVEEENSMLVSESGQNNNGYLVNITEKCSPVKVTQATSNILINNNLIQSNNGNLNNSEFAPPSNPPPLAVPQKYQNSIISEVRSSLLTSLPLASFRRDLIPSTTLVLDKATNTINRSPGSVRNQTKSDKIIQKGASAKLANELIKRLQEPDLLALNSNLKYRTNKVHSLPPTEFHRQPNIRESTSVDSLVRDMCHFKPIKPAPITPNKRQNALILKIPVPKRASTRTRKSNFFIGPKKGVMPVLFSTTTSDRFSAFCLYKSNLIVSKKPPLSKLKKLKTLERTTSLEDQRSTKNDALFKNKCIVRLERCSIPPILFQQYNVNISNVLAQSKSPDVIKKCNGKTRNRKNPQQKNKTKSVSCSARYQPSTSKKICDLEPSSSGTRRRSIRRQLINVKLANECFEGTVKSVQSSVSNAAARGTTVNFRLQKKQERLDFEFAKRLQEKYQTEYGSIEPIAKRLRKCISSEIDSGSRNSNGNGISCCRQHSQCGYNNCSTCSEKEKTGQSLASSSNN